MVEDGPWFIMNLPEATPLIGCGNIEDRIKYNTNIALFNTKWDAELALNVKLYFTVGLDREIREYYEVMKYEDS
jgi:hypothetical protein